MSSYIKILLALFLHIILCDSSAQTITDRNEIGGGWLQYPPEDENYIEGTRNLYDAFRPGVVYYKDGSNNLQVLLRFNIYNDEFEYLENDTLYALEGLIHLEKIEFDGQDFIYLEPNRKASVSGYVVRWNDELPTVVTKMRMGYFNKEIGPVGKPKRFERDPDTHYIMNTHNEFEQIYSIKKLIKYLGSHKEELRSFVKKEKISASNPEELAKLLDYFQKLEQDL